MQMKRLQDRVALVFGAGSSEPGWSNGKAAAVAYAREGARVVVIDRVEAAARETVEFIEAVRELKRLFPAAKTSGGVSNVSFSFRGPEFGAVREAMNSAFLYHAIKAGLDMGIVNAGQLVVYDEIEPGLRELCEDVILNRNNDNNEATEKLIAFAETVKAKGKVEVKDEAWRNTSVEERLKHSLVNGITDYIDIDTEEV